MLIHFLGASVPLTKSFTLEKSGAITKDAYPLVEAVTSYDEDITTAAEFYAAIKQHAAQGHCLLKGLLSRPLMKESRRGTTKTDDASSWICLDFDRHESPSIDDSLSRLGLGDVSYVLQYSASQGMPDTEGTLSAHVFMLLTKPVSAPDLKAWLMDINLKYLRDDIHLSRSKMMLSWPLDITTCQNDKLLYIAPPGFRGMKDPLSSRIELCPKKIPAMPVDRIGGAHINALKLAERKLLNELRKGEDLPSRLAKTSWVGTCEIQNKPDVCSVTGIKETGDYVRLNINGGDSWAYWHHRDSFELIHDFKADTWYKTKELLPAYYAELMEARQALTATPTEEGDLILAFRDMKTAEYFNGLWNPNTGNLELHRARNETQLDHWMRSHGRVIGDYIPVWDMRYDPLASYRVDAENHVINTFISSPYYDLEPDAKARFPKIEYLIKHLLGINDGSPENAKLYEHFINWFAVVFKRKGTANHPITAWVLQGIQGCLAGDTEIKFHQQKKSGRPVSIKTAFEKFNGTYQLGTGKGRTWDTTKPVYAQCVKDEFTVGYSEVLNIVESGVKMIYRVVSSDGGLIRVTHKHPFMRPDGSFTPLCDLKLGDKVLRRGEALAHIRHPKGRNKKRVTIYSIPQHPTAWQHIINGKNYKRSHKARLAWEAWMNNMPLDQFINVLRNDPITASKLTYLSDDLIVHHIDEDCTNDELSNLTTIDKLDHDKHHAKETGLGTILTKEVSIVSITEDCEEMTYDMTMKAPYHNYVANGFCVKNTGKGSLFNKIILPLFGHQNVFAAQVQNIEEGFNGWLQNKQFIMVEEVDVDDFKDKGRISAKLKQYITEPKVPFRQMRQTAVWTDNYASFLFASNKPQPVHIEASDRRYNCGNYQRLRLNYPGDEAIDSELEAFASFLLAHKADAERANQIIQTEARTRIQQLGVTSIDETCRWIVEGDFEALWYSMPDEQVVRESPITNSVTADATAYITLMKRLLHDVVNEPKNRLSRDEMYILIQYHVGQLSSAPGKFTSLLRHHGIDTKQIRRNGQKTYGIELTWQISEEFYEEIVKPKLTLKSMRMVK